MALKFVSKTEITGSSVVNQEISLPTTTGHHEVHLQDFHALASGGILDITMRRSSDNGLTTTATYNVTNAVESRHVYGYQGGAYCPAEAHNGFNINTNQTAGMRGTVIVYEVIS